MTVSTLTIAEHPDVGVVLEAGGDYEFGTGGLCEELLLKAVAVVSAALDEREDMSSPLVKGDQEAIRQVYGDEAADKCTSEPVPKPKIEPGTILRFPS